MRKMKLLDDKYEKDYYESSCHDCKTGFEFSNFAIKGLGVIVTCPHCKSKFFIKNTIAKDRQGLHKPTIELYNAVILETGNYKHGRMTLRHLFYRLVSNGSLKKTEAQYDKLIKDVGNMRKTGILSYKLFADGTRWMRKPNTYDGIRQALEDTVDFYRKSLWQDNDHYVEFWIEKDAVADIVYEITDRYDVPLMVARGFSSLTFIYESATNIADTGKQAFVYHIGDYDPSGIAAAKSIENTFKGFGVDVTFQRLAVTAQQIFDFNLPTRPTKKSNHTKDFKGESVEIDAMEPHIIQGLVEAAILQHIDTSELQRLKGIERAERNTLKQYIENFGG